MFINFDLFSPNPGRGCKHKFKAEIEEPVDHFMPVDYKSVAYQKACKTQIKLTIHFFSSSFKVIGLFPDFLDSFSCICTLPYIAKLVTFSFFLQGLIGNALSALLRD